MLPQSLSTQPLTDLCNFLADALCLPKANCTPIYTYGDFHYGIRHDAPWYRGYGFDGKGHYVEGRMMASDACHEFIRQSIDRRIYNRHSDRNYLSSKQIKWESAPEDLQEYWELQQQNPEALVFYQSCCYFDQAFIASRFLPGLLTDRRELKEGMILALSAPERVEAKLYQVLREAGFKVVLAG